MTQQKKRPEVLSLKVPDKQALYMAYMPFMKNKGIFVRKEGGLRMGDEVFLIVDIWCEAEKVTLPGKVVWVTPKNAQNSKKAGYGIEISSQEGKILASTIERILGHSINSKHTTFTM